MDRSLVLIPLGFILLRWQSSISVVASGNCAIPYSYYQKQDKHINNNKMSQKFQEIINSEKPVLIEFLQLGANPCKVQSSFELLVKEQVGDSARIIKNRHRPISCYRLRSTM